MGHSREKQDGGDRLRETTNRRRDVRGWYIGSARGAAARSQRQPPSNERIGSDVISGSYKWGGLVKMSSRILLEILAGTKTLEEFGGRLFLQTAWQSVPTNA